MLNTASRGSVLLGCFFSEMEHQQVQRTRCLFFCFSTRNCMLIQRSPRNTRETAISSVITLFEQLVPPQDHQQTFMTRNPDVFSPSQCPSSPAAMSPFLMPGIPCFSWPTRLASLAYRAEAQGAYCMSREAHRIPRAASEKLLMADAASTPSLLFCFGPHPF